MGYTFISGALQAWIADELGVRDLGRVYLRGEQADYLGSLIGECVRGGPLPDRPGRFWLVGIARRLGESL